MNDAAELPPGFEALGPYVATWGKDTRQARLDVRLGSSDETLGEYYAVASPLLASAIAYLDERPGSDDPRDRCLLVMMLALVQAALAVERLGDQEQGHQVSHRHFRYR